MLPQGGWRRQGRGEAEVPVLARGTACGHLRLLAPGGGTEVAWGEWARLFPSRVEGEQTPDPPVHPAGALCRPRLLGPRGDLAWLIWGLHLR